LSATLTIVRRGTGIELRSGTYDVLVDGARVGTVAQQGSVEIPIEAGSHALQLRRGRYSSPVRSFSAADGEVVAFRCYGAAIWPRWLASYVVPNLAITLHHVSGGRPATV